ncbi:MAG: triose-phosphate isomerase [candidate division Zixibacteria bacterium]|nr:triose-phosphate isomerase [candidate division Zixibacteria bacterium]
MTTRRSLIVGNWKMFTAIEDGIALARAISERTSDAEYADIVLCPTYCGLYPIGELLRNTRIAVGGQNMHWETEGPFTGEISARMLLTCGCRYVILGHSERRTHFGETDAVVNKKTLQAIAAGLIPIVCVGETMAQREAGLADRVVETQVREGLSGLSGEQIAGITVAYEPVWAIGTGRVATPELADEIHTRIRNLLAAVSNRETANAVRVLYGGSVKPDNAAALLAKSNIDGVLVGGASLHPDSFTAIVEAARS